MVVRYDSIELARRAAGRMNPAFSYVASNGTAELSNSPNDAYFFIVPARDSS